MRRLAAVAALVLMGLGCGEGGGEPLTVFAAASLSDVFTVLGARFEAEHGVEVTLAFAGSQQLVAQIGQGADADVVATADEASMEALDVDSQVFAANRLAIVVERGNPLGIATVADLARGDVTLVVAAPAVPAGRAAAEVLRRAAVEARPQSYEANVRAVVNRVALGEADAGLAYVTDAAAAADAVDAVAIPDAHNAVVRYPIAALTDDPLATAFVDLVRSADGQAALQRQGFSTP